MPKGTMPPLEPAIVEAPSPRRRVLAEVCAKIMEPHIETKIIELDDYMDCLLALRINLDERYMNARIFGHGSTTHVGMDGLRKIYHALKPYFEGENNETGKQRTGTDADSGCCNRR